MARLVKFWSSVKFSHWLLIAEFVLLVAVGTLTICARPQHPHGFVWLAGAVALWPALRIAHAFGPVRGVLASQVLVIWLQFADRLPRGFSASRIEAWIVVTNAVVCVLLLLNAAIRRAVAQAPASSQGAAPE